MTRRLRAPGTLIGLLRAAVDRCAEKIAFRHGDRSLTFGELEVAVRSAAGALSSGGVRHGHVVANGCADPLDRVVVHFGTLQAGALAVPLDPEYRGELDAILPAADVRTLVADAPVLEHALGMADDGRWEPARLYCAAGDAPADAQEWREAVAIAPHAPERRLVAGDPAVLCFTAGTSGPPKGVAHTHARCVNNLEAVRRAWDWNATDVLYCASPLHHVDGLLNGVHGTLLTGCTTVFPGPGPLRADTADAALAELAAERCSLVFASPAHYDHLCDAAERAPKTACTVREAARCLMSGSAPLAARTADRVRTLFGEPPLERYGMTETLMICSTPIQGARPPGTVGMPLPGMAVRVVESATATDCAPGEPGEVWVRGASLFDGYHSRPGFPHPADAGAFVDGWFRSGDLGSWDDDGRLRLHGRCAPRTAGG